jgi:hypothetical protein
MTLDQFTAAFSGVRNLESYAAMPEMGQATTKAWVRSFDLRTCAAHLRTCAAPRQVRRATCPAPTDKRPRPCSGGHVQRDVRCHAEPGVATNGDDPVCSTVKGSALIQCSTGSRRPLKGALPGPGRDLDRAPVHGWSRDGSSPRYRVRAACLGDAVVKESPAAVPGQVGDLLQRRPVSMTSLIAAGMGARRSRFRAPSPIGI